MDPSTATSTSCLSQSLVELGDSLSLAPFNSGFKNEVTQSTSATSPVAVATSPTASFVSEGGPSSAPPQPPNMDDLVSSFSLGSFTPSSELEKTPSLQSPLQTAPPQMMATSVVPSSAPFTSSFQNPVFASVNTPPGMAANLILFSLYIFS